MTKFRLDREKYWISALQTAYPFGLNVRIKGIGDFNPSQERYHDFGGRRRRKRPHGKRKPRRLRPAHDATVNFVVGRHQALQNSRQYLHFFKQYLYGLPRRNLNQLWNEINLPDDTTEVRVKDMINMIAQLRLFKPVSIIGDLKGNMTSKYYFMVVVFWVRNILLVVRNYHCI